MSIIRMLVLLHDRCRSCGTNVATVSFRRLICDACEIGRGLIGKDLRARLEKHVHKFGQPERPLILRTNKVFEPGSVGDDAATATETKPKTKRKAKSKMKVTDLFPSKYLRAADLNGIPRTVTIVKVTHDVFKDNGVDVTKAILHFKEAGTAPVVVNKTNWNMLAAITGEDDDERWVGTEIELKSQKVSGPGGKIVDSIRIHEAV
jgi:hypothetical protein